MIQPNRLQAITLGAAMGAGTALVVGLPTDVIPNPWFTRMIPTHPQDYVFLAITVLLATILGATFAFPTSCEFQAGKLAGGGALSFLTVRCPICNKLVLIMLGTGGALRYIEPIQPLLGFASGLPPSADIWIRLRAIRSTGLIPVRSIETLMGERL